MLEHSHDLTSDNTSVLPDYASKTDRRYSLLPCAERMKALPTTGNILVFLVAHLEQGIILQVHVERVKARHDTRHEQGRVEARGKAPRAGRGTTHAGGHPPSGGHLVHQHVQHMGRQAHLLHEVQRLHGVWQ